MRRRAFVNQFLSCFLPMPVICISSAWSCVVGYLIVVQQADERAEARRSMPGDRSQVLTGVHPQRGGRV